MALCAAVLASAGCQSGGTASGGKTSLSDAPPVSKRTAAACILVKQPDATVLFGRAAQQVAVQNAAGATSVCGWRASTSSDPNAVDGVVYSLLVYVYDDVTHYSEKIVKGARVLTGLGDRAFTAQAADLLTVEFVDHGQTISLRYAITALVAHPSSRADLHRLVDLARSAAQRV